MSLIDDPLKLMTLEDRELDETLLDEKYNKALLRELVRRSLKVAKDYKGNYEYEKESSEESD